MIDIFSRSKISLGLNAPAFYCGWKPLGRLFFKKSEFIFEKPRILLDVLNFPANLREWWQKRIRQIKARTFEINACRTMQITQTADNLQDYYEIGKEIVIYEDEDDLIQKTCAGAATPPGAIPARPRFALRIGSARHAHTGP